MARVVRIQPSSYVTSGNLKGIWDLRPGCFASGGLAWHGRFDSAYISRSYMCHLPSQLGNVYPFTNSEKLAQLRGG